MTDLRITVDFKYNLFIGTYRLFIGYVISMNQMTQNLDRRRLISTQDV